VVILASPHARPFAEGGHDDGRALIEPADEVEQKLATGLGQGQIAEFIQHDEVHPGQTLGESSLPSVAGLGLEAIDEIDYVEEAAAGTGSDAACGDGNGQVGFACASAANQNDVALLGDGAAASEIIDKSQRFVRPNGSRCHRGIGLNLDRSSDCAGCDHVLVVVEAHRHRVEAVEAAGIGNEFGAFYVPDHVDLP
jgi:hypothetical protein